jgi:ribosomal protein S18 acetylase RimI-like enzyme
MKNWAVENGTLWVVDPGESVPAMCRARVPVTFREVETADIPALAEAMNLSDTALIEGRLQNGRRCFFLQADSQIVTYGWVTLGTESVGELERQFHLHDDEAYIWHCGTLVKWRGQRCYSAFLSHILHQLIAEGVACIWIGATRQNRPSVKGFVNAGFQPVVDVVYRRFLRLSLFWVSPDPSARQTLINEAYRILINAHEYRLGRLAIGYYLERLNGK